MKYIRNLLILLSFCLNEDLVKAQRCVITCNNFEPIRIESITDLPKIWCNERLARRRCHSNNSSAVWEEI